MVVVVLVVVNKPPPVNPPWCLLPTSKCGGGGELPRHCLPLLLRAVGGGVWRGVLAHSTHIFLRDQKRDTPPPYGAFIILIWGVEQVWLKDNDCRAIKKRHSKPPKIAHFFLIWWRTIFYFPR